MKTMIPDRLKTAKSVMITGHTGPDGDCVGSCLGLYHFIRENYPQIRVDVRLEEVPKVYRAIPGADQILTQAEDDVTYDLVITSDASARDRFETFARYFDSASYRICIDHHISNTGFADENYIVPGASSASEIVADIIVGIAGEAAISYNIAYALYVGMICDSGVFKYSCTGRRTMEIAGMLMEKGIPYTAMIDDFFYRKTFRQNLVLARCLQLCRLEAGGRLILCRLDQQEQQALEASHDDLEGIVAQMRLTEGVEAAIFSYEKEDGSWKFSLRSDHIIDVSRIASAYGGGGHMRAAGFSLTSDAACAEQALVREMEAQLAACTME